MQNKFFSVAMAATLALPVGVAQAVGLDNVNASLHYNGGDTDKCIVAQETATGTKACVLNGSNVPHDSFDNITGGEPVVSVPVSGIVYARELCVGDGPQKLPNSQTKMVAAIYTISTNTDITDQLKVIFTLSDGVFAATSKLAISDTDGNFDSLPIDIDGGVGKEFVTFLVDANADNPLKNDDQLMFVYQFKSASSLATEGNKVGLTVEIKKKSNDTIIVNPTRTIAVASCKQAVTAALTSETGGSIQIDVSEDSKLFTGAAPALVDGSQNATAQLGYFKITNVSTDAQPIMQSDGETQFKIGVDTDGKVVAPDPNNNVAGSTLAIFNGQFTASKTAPGQVYLYELDGGPVAAQANVGDDTTATFDLNNATLQNLSDKNLAIRMDVDRTTVIGPTDCTQANPPLAQLAIDFEQDYVEFLGLTEQVALIQICQNGTVCMVYNVPNSLITREKVNIRVTNDSNVDGTLSGRMYADDGTVIGSGSKPLGDVGAGGTAFFNATSLETIFGAWDGRATLEITSTLPRLEVLTLMRNQFDRSLLTNVSTGATGKSCTQ